MAIRLGFLSVQAPLGYPFFFAHALSQFFLKSRGVCRPTIKTNTLEKPPLSESIQTLQTPQGQSFHLNFPIFQRLLHLKSATRSDRTLRSGLAYERSVRTLRSGLLCSAPWAPCELQGAELHAALSEAASGEAAWPDGGACSEALRQRLMDVTLGIEGWCDRWVHVCVCVCVAGVWGCPFGEEFWFDVG